MFLSIKCFSIFFLSRLDTCFLSFFLKISLIFFSIHFWTVLLIKRNNYIEINKCVCLFVLFTFRKYVLTNDSTQCNILLYSIGNGSNYENSDKHLQPLSKANGTRFGFFFQKKKDTKTRSNKENIHKIKRKRSKSPYFRWSFVFSIVSYKSVARCVMLVGMSVIVCIRSIKFII